MSSSRPPPLLSLTDAKDLPTNLTGRVKMTKTTPFSRGGFSDVYEGKLEGRSGKVAIKIFRDPGVSDRQTEVRSGSVPTNSGDKTRKRFYRECGVWCQLTHRNVQPFLGVSFDWSLDSFPAIISPFCEFGNAFDYLLHHPEANRKNIIVGTAAGLQYLHSRNVIHGDLKARNVLIDDQGIARVCDFGRSKVLKQTGYTTDLSTTAYYIAPELMMAESGQRDSATASSGKPFAACLSKASDVYAFGMVTLELLTSQPAWHGFEAVNVIVLVAKGQRPSRRWYEPVGDIRWAFLEECWASNPDQRPTMIDIVPRLLQW